MFIRGVSQAIKFVLRDITDGSLVTAGTPVCWVTKDLAAQAAATNAAVHLGNGQWSLTLTAAELTAEVVGVLITESGSAAVDREIVTVPDMAAVSTRVLLGVHNAAPGANGGAPTVDANNRIAGIAGTINTLDSLDTAQDTQHAATMTRLGVPIGASVVADIATKASQASVNSVPSNVVAALNADATYQELVVNVGLSLTAIGNVSNSVNLQTADLDAIKGSLTAVDAKIGTPADTLAEDIAGIEGGGGGLTIPVNQVAVPESRTWILEATSLGLVGDFPKGLKVGDPQVFALDFRNDLAANGRVVAVEAVEIVSVDGVAAGEGEAGVTWSLAAPEDAGVDKAQGKLRLTGVEAGTYVIDVKVAYGPQDGSGEPTGRVTLVVVE